jgi:hypothetical protein
MKKIVLNFEASKSEDGGYDLCASPHGQEQNSDFVGLSTPVIFVTSSLRVETNQIYQH